MRLAIDVDETVADTLSRYIEWYSRDFGKTISLKDLDGTKPYQIIPPEHRRRVRTYPNDPTFFEDLPLIADAQAVIKELAEDHEVFFVTAAMEFPTSFSAKYAWLTRHFPFVDPLHYVFCGNKSIIAADYLIDDSPRHFEYFAGTGLLFSAPHNTKEHRYFRLGSWKDVKAFFDELG